MMHVDDVTLLTARLQALRNRQGGPDGAEGGFGVNVGKYLVVVLLMLRLMLRFLR